MEHPGFFERAGPLRLGDIAEKSEAECAPGTNPDQMVADIATLADAGPQDLSFLENPKYLDQYLETRAGACIVAEKHAGQGPSQTAKLIAGQPYRSFALALALFYPDALHSSTLGTQGWAPGQTVHPQANLEDDVVVEPGACIGAEASIGSGTRIAAGAVIGARVHIGRDCSVGPNVSLTNTLVGNRVIIHAGVSIGQDGFGFAMGPGGHLKVPQIGRVIIQDDVEIGANSTIDRGALRDTVIGEGTKIDNLVQIGHNVVTGRHCVIVSQVGISGSTELGDFVVLGGKVGTVGHIRIGDGANIAAGSGVIGNVPAGETWSGYPARPHRQWLRQAAMLNKLASTGLSGSKEPQKPSDDTSDE